jgi:predicted component of type VI protein secretion system
MRRAKANSKRFGFLRHLRASRKRRSAAAPNRSTQTAPERAEPRVAPAQSATMAPPDVDQLEAEERYHRERLALYRARSYSSRPTSPTRLRELGRIWEAAKARLTHARSQRR